MVGIEEWGLEANKRYLAQDGNLNFELSLYASYENSATYKILRLSLSIKMIT